MATEEAQETYQWKNNRNQYFATISANLVAFSHGCILGWTSPALPILASSQTPLISGPLTNEQISWIGSVSNFGGIFGALSFGYITTLLGSKITVAFLAIPVITNWLLIYFGNTYYHIFMAKLFSGVGGGASFSVILLFISEIANDKIRGRLGSVMLFARNFGTLIGYVLGATVEYEYIPLISGVFPIAFLIIFITIPNTPQFYLRKGQTQEAEKALKFYKGYKGNDHREDDAINQEFERLKMIANERKKDGNVQLADFFTKDALKGLAIGVGLTTLVASTCSFTIQSYAVMTFAKVGTFIDPIISSIMMALTLIFGSLSSTYLADKIGRKKLNLISFLGCALGLFFTSLFHYLNLCGYDLSAFAWTPVLSLCLVVFLSSAGIAPLSFVCSVEYLGSKIRTYGMAVITCCAGTVAFVSTKMYPLLLESLDLHGCLMIYGTGCVIGFVFVLVILEETSGKSLDNICTDNSQTIGDGK